MLIYQLPVLSDNYLFILYDPTRQIAAVVDPGDAAPVLKQLRDLKAELVAIFNTHHDWDHVTGNAQLLKQFPNAIVYGGAEDRGRIPGQRVFLQSGDLVEFADRQAEVLFVPGHTRGHIAYYFPPVEPNQPGELFCGDTLFSAGCGRLKEGTPEQMLRSLSQIRSLPDHTRVWCAHEYTLTNLKFALSIEPENETVRSRLAEVEELRRQGKATIPSEIGLEKQINPFLRWDQPAIQQVIGQKDEISTFAAVRSRKDQFKLPSV
jgi:hydroxyacylglutathione hydrolase